MTEADKQKVEAAAVAGVGAGVGGAGGATVGVLDWLRRELPPGYPPDWSSARARSPEAWHFSSVIKLFDN